jgi:hypothetical protein
MESLFHAKPVHKRDQARPALIRNTAFLLDPGAKHDPRPTMDICARALSPQTKFSLDAEIGFISSRLG